MSIQSGRRIEKVNELIPVHWDDYVERTKLGLLLQYLAAWPRFNHSFKRKAEWIMNMYNEALAMKDTLTADRRHFPPEPGAGSGTSEDRGLCGGQREMGYEPPENGKRRSGCCRKEAGKMLPDPR